MQSHNVTFIRYCVIALHVNDTVELLHVNIMSTPHPVDLVCEGYMCAECSGLYDNQLTGTLPSELGALTNLAYMCVCAVEAQ